MKPLSLADQLFLWIEQRQQPLHVGGLMLFDFPEDAGSRYMTDIAEFMRSFEKPSAPFNQRLEKRLGQYYWKEDPQFDLEHHFRHSALPKPGRIRELLSLVSVKHSSLMDRARPMWECHLIEGVRGKHFALYSKTHHCMFDGVAAMRTMERLLSEDPNKRDMPPFWAMPQTKKKKKKSEQDMVEPRTDAIGSLSSLLNTVGAQISTLPKLVKEVGHSINQAQTNPDFVSAFQAPPSILNSSITGSRRFAAQSYPIERFKNIAKRTNATLNDVVLAVCGSALRNYLISQRALPTKPLVAMVPMNLRTDASSTGNQIAMILASLATHVSDPAERLNLIQRSIVDAKNRFSDMTLDEAVNYTALTLAPGLLNAMTGISSKLQAFNVIISNVPGPKKPLYWNGARMSGTYPVSIPFDRVALNITLVSYVDNLEFGFTACRRCLPSMQRLLDYVDQGINELEIAAGIA